MTTVKKKKKVKTDAKQSQQLRKWLTKEKDTKCAHPVSFETFRKLVENLPDISFEIQVTEATGRQATLDECALWFYNAFYTDPTVRANYEVKLRSCPQSIREKLFEFPAKETTSRETLPADGVEVAVTKCGRFLFPVTLATFEQYIDKESLLPALARMHSKSKKEREAFLKDKNKWRTVLQKFYNTFYIFPKRRKFGFKEAPPALLTQLLKEGIPLDDLAFKIIEANEEKASNTSESPQAAVSSPKSISSIVSFAVFEKYISNIYDVVWRLKIDDPEFAYRGFEDCALAYYLAFYLTPEIRDKYPFEIAPCTTAMRNRILGFANPYDVKMLLDMKTQSQQLASSQESAISVVTPVEEQVQTVKAPEIAAEIQLPFAGDVRNEEPETSNKAQPVTFAVFKSHIRNLDRIVDEMMSCGEYMGKSKKDCALEYFKAFYRTPQIREKYEYEIKPCPARMREKLLAIPEVEPPTLTDKPTTTETKTRDLFNEKQLVKVQGVTYVYSVTFETFKRFINYDELRDQIVDFHAKNRDKLGEYSSEEQLLKHFYYAFYIDENWRHKFNYNFNAAPPKLRPMLMSMAVPLATRSAQSTNEVPKTVATRCTRDDQEQAEHEEPLNPEQYKQMETEEQLVLNTEPQTVLGAQIDPEKRTEPEEPLDAEQQIAEVEEIEAVPHIDAAEQTESEEQAMFEEYLEPEEQMEHYVQTEYMEVEVEQPVHENQLYVVEQTVQEPQIEQEEIPDLQPVHENQLYVVQQSVPEPQTEQEEIPDFQPALEYQFYEDQQREFEEQHAHEEQPVCEEYNTEASPLPYRSNDLNSSNANKSNHVVVLSERVIITLQGITYEFPVSIQAFKRFINYDTLKVELAKSFAKKKNNIMKVLNDERSNFILLRRFYNSFYIDSRVRKKFNFNFDAAPKELQEKLLQYAIPLSLTTKCVRSNEVKETPKINQQDVEMQEVPTVPEAQRVPVEPQVAIVTVSQEVPAAPLSPEAPRAPVLPELPAGVPAAPAAPISLVEPEEVLQNDESYPVSFRIFSKILRLDDVVKQMQQEPQHAQKTANDCKLAYYEAFYRSPQIRDKYICTLRPCPAALKAKILELPKLMPTIDENQSRTSTQETIGLPQLYAARGAELNSLKKRNVVEYIPHNLGSYIARRLPCPKKRALLEKHFVSRKRCQVTRPSEDSAADPKDIAGRSTEKLDKEADTVSKPVSGSTTSTSRSSEKPAKAAGTAVECNPREYTASKSKEVAASSQEKPVVNTTAAKPTTGLNAKTPARSPQKPVRSTVPAAAAEPTPVRTNPKESTAETVKTSGLSAKIPKKVAARSPQKPVRATVPAAVAEPTPVRTNPKKFAAAKAALSTQASEVISISSTPSSDSVPSTQASQASSQNEATVPIAAASNPAKTVASVESKIMSTFLSPICKEHNMKYLLYTSHGLSKTIWHILSQLSMLEFKTYTGIYGGELLYRNESVLGQIYSHVIENGNWPITLYVKLSMLGKLLQSRGVYVERLDMAQLSPKIFHWHELSSFTDFDDIVEYEHRKRTNGNIKDLVQLFAEVELLYTRCWTRNRWIGEVPQITDRQLIGPITRDENLEIPKSTIPICLTHHPQLALDAADVIPLEESPLVMESGTSQSPEGTECPATQLDEPVIPDSQLDVSVGGASQLDVSVGGASQLNVSVGGASQLDVSVGGTSQLDVSVGGTSQLDVSVGGASQLNVSVGGASQLDVSVGGASQLDVSVGGASQLNVPIGSPNFVDIESVCPATQAAESQSDPLMQSTYEPVSIPIEAVPIKQEPVKFLNQMRFVINSDQSGEFCCETIPTEEQVINLDTEDDERIAQELACFELSNPSATSVLPSSLDNQFQALLHEMHLDSQSSSQGSKVDSIEPPQLIQAQAAVAEVEKSKAQQDSVAVPPKAEPLVRVSVAKKQIRATTSTVPSKKQRLMADNVPQLRHDFRPLPLAAMVRIETTENARTDLPTTSNQGLFTAVSQGVSTDISQGLPAASSQQPSTATTQALFAASKQGLSTAVRQEQPTASSQRLPTSTSKLVPTTASQAATASIQGLPTASSQELSTATSQALFAASKQPTASSQGLPTATSQEVPTTSSQSSTASNQGLPTASSQELSTTSSQGQQSGQMTVSQALATDNTLMESSQLQHLLDAPYVNQRQVNVNEMEVDGDSSNKNDRAALTTAVPAVVPVAIRVPTTVLDEHIVFSNLQRYLYFNSLTTANIARYQLNTLAVGTSYEQALISANGKLCNVYGPLLENLFPHCSNSLLNDLQYLLTDVGDFSYNCRLNLHRESTEDLRSRVLFAFMRAAPPFARIRLRFENESREWASCSTIAERDGDTTKRVPSCDVSSGLKPQILERMKELKSLNNL